MPEVDEAIKAREKHVSSELDRVMAKMKAMGVTVNVNLAPGTPEDAENRPSALIAEAAKRAGIYYTNEGNN